MATQPATTPRPAAVVVVPNNKSNMWKWILGIVAIIVVLFLAWYFMKKSKGKTLTVTNGNGTGVDVGAGGDGGLNIRRQG
ncbi:MAG: hypothetical protein H0X03_08075 [Nitrosopumilus sp.]|nr:hypothetical protein [Nitrosopumilus sp.]